MQRCILLLILCCCFCGNAQSGTSSACEFFRGNGYCDDFNNNEDCDWDGGDCCTCTCIDSDFLCKDNIFDNCQDPDVLGVPADGYCEQTVNDLRCAYDGGDCCPCTCSNCTESDCFDPAARKQVYDCEDAPKDLFPCEDGHTVELEVGTIAQARDLVEAINCSGGVFIVSWRGNIVVDETIWVIDGTILNVTGNGSNAEMDGNGVTRLFTVVNAFLYVSDMKISNGNAIGGGAIGASGSTLTFQDTSFTGNIASKDGGAIFATEGSNISFNRDTVFFNNTASSGGALYITNFSSVSWEGKTTFMGNDAGALSVTGGSMVSWAEEVTFLGQKGDAALTLQDGSTASWTKKAIFSGNTHRALSVGGRSSVTWKATTNFSGNVHVENGGAIYVDGSSRLSWTAETAFYNNDASKGGALSAEGNSDISWTATTFFSNNAASEEGGAIYVDGSSSVSWTAETAFDHNNASKGGVLSVEGESDISWTATTFFSSNAASEEGGAIYVDEGSSVSSIGETTFYNNNATRGGAVSVQVNGDICWDASTRFSSNTANQEGGAIYVDNGGNISGTEEAIFSKNNASRGGALFGQGDSSIRWTSATNFSSNTAIVGGGGAIYIGEDCEARWTGDTIFSGNVAHSFGGAVAVVGGSVSWNSTTSFFKNFLWLYQKKEGRGGALFIGDSSDVSWTGETVFENNSAGDRGGGIFITSASTLEWSGETNFTSNFAGSYGGAVGSEDLDRSLSLSTGGDGGQPSSLKISSATHFINNTSDGSGGGMALLRMLDFTLSTDDEVIFTENSATISGGGVYISATEGGPILSGMRFVSNTASAGGGLYAAGSGTEIDRCSFIDNSAVDTGGAIDSVDGVNSLMNTEFRGNTAQVGGALRLSGTATMSNCSFLENISGMDGGPAVYNDIGSLRDIKNCTFLDNVFDCDNGTYFSFNGVGHKSETVCYECDVCDTCVYGDLDMIPTCELALGHTTSDGGTIEQLVIDAGYWRATNSSINILECYNDEACNGGITGDPDYCEGGYEGAYCSVCAKNYAPGLGKTCTKCSDTTDGIILAIVLIALGIIVGATLVLHLVSKEMGGTGRSLVDRITRNIPLNTLKIVIVTWQILTQFAEVARVTYPDIYQDFLDAVNLVNFDLSWVLAVECLIHVDFHGKMLFSTTGPIVIMGLLATTYMIAATRNHGATEALRHLRRKHLSMVLLLTFLVYSSVSSVLFKMFDCEKLDDGKIYLRADYSIECTSVRHKSLMAYSAIMILVYPVGIPVLYTYLLSRNRAVLMDGVYRETDESVQSTTDLWKPYKPSRFYYEVIECGRRLLLTGGVLLIDDNTTAQVSVIFMIAVCFALLLEILAPYESRMDVWVSRTGHAVVYGSMYFALLQKTEISNDTQASQKVFEWVLITMQAILVVLVVINAVVLAYSSREENRVGPGGKVPPRENFAGLVVSNRHIITRVRALSNPRRQALVVHPS